MSGGITRRKAVALIGSVAPMAALPAVAKAMPEASKPDSLAFVDGMSTDMQIMVRLYQIRAMGSGARADLIAVLRADDVLSDETVDAIERFMMEGAA